MDFDLVWEQQTHLRLLNLQIDSLKSSFKHFYPSLRGLKAFALLNFNYYKWHLIFAGKSSHSSQL
jgi:hypothetical protein